MEMSEMVWKIDKNLWKSQRKKFQDRSLKPEESFVISFLPLDKQTFAHGFAKLRKSDIYILVSSLGCVTF